MQGSIQTQPERSRRTRWLRRALGVCAGVWLTSQPAAQVSDFQIVWVNVGEAATMNGEQPARAGRRLFDANTLMALTLEMIRIDHVVVEPAIHMLTVQDTLCVSSLRIRAFDAQRHSIPAAPLTITVRQDHRERLRLKRTRRDICVEPQDAGEYPLRLTSLLPATDGSMRGAQIFLRVAGPQVSSESGEMESGVGSREE